MALLPGVYIAKKKDGTLYFRSSITYKNKHISLGSFSTEEKAYLAYMEANRLLKTPSISLDLNYTEHSPLPFEKWVILINFRDNHMYIKTPIYMKNRFFLYYLSQHIILKFDVDDLFFYATHKIMKRGGHLFVADFGMQINILSRYGIKNFSVPGKDYIFVNGDTTDFRYANLKIINRYNGVFREEKKGQVIYTAKIHIVGDYIIGRYSSEIEAAIAYNKAAKLLWEKGVSIRYTLNYISELSKKEYDTLYASIKLSKKLYNYQPPTT